MSPLDLGSMDKYHVPKKPSDNPPNGKITTQLPMAVVPLKKG